MTRIEKTINWAALWAARLALAVLAFAGAMHLLGGLDPIIQYAFSGTLVAFLLKETL